MQRRNLLAYQNYRYFKLTTLLLGSAIAAYVLHRPALGPYGGTWLGYTLGTVSLIIIIHLLWFGVRKRQYRGIGTLQGWLSAHVYLGISLIVLTTLHTGFQFGWNVHTLAYALTLCVIASGFYGLYAYMKFPQLISENLREDSLDSLRQKITELDDLARLNALQLPDDINLTIIKACNETQLGGNIIELLSKTRKNCPTATAVKILREQGKNLKGSQPRLHRELYAIMLRRETLVNRARRDIMLMAWMQIWLYVHVPMAVALLVSLIAHITSVFFYW